MMNILLSIVVLITSIKVVMLKAPLILTPLRHWKKSSSPTRELARHWLYSTASSRPVEPLECVLTPSLLRNSCANRNSLGQCISEILIARWTYIGIQHYHTPMCTFWKVGTVDSSASLRIDVNHKNMWRWITLPIGKCVNVNWESSVAAQSWGELRHITLVPTRASPVEARMVASEKGRSAITTQNFPRVLSCLSQGDLLRVSPFTANWLATAQPPNKPLFWPFEYHNLLASYITSKFALAYIFGWDGVRILSYQSRAMGGHRLGHLIPKSELHDAFCTPKSTIAKVAAFHLGFSLYEIQDITTSTWSRPSPRRKRQFLIGNRFLCPFLGLLLFFSFFSVLPLLICMDKTPCDSH